MSFSVKPQINQNTDLFWLLSNIYTMYHNHDHRGHLKSNLNGNHNQSIEYNRGHNKFRNINTYIIRIINIIKETNKYFPQKQN